MKDNIPTGLIFRDEYLAKTREIFGDDPFPYGVKANQKMLQTIIDFSHEQGLTKQKLKIEELFAPATLEL
jgi:4,5-dihydroxyphthalate decarboxylase